MCSQLGRPSDANHNADDDHRRGCYVDDVELRVPGWTCGRVIHVHVSDVNQPERQTPNVEGVGITLGRNTSDIHE